MAVHLHCGQSLQAKLCYKAKEDNRETDLIKIAVRKELPVVWFQLKEDRHAVYFMGGVILVHDPLTALFTYSTIFTVADLDWNEQLYKVDDEGNEHVTRKDGMPTKRSLEFIHCTLLSASVDLKAAGVKRLSRDAATASTHRIALRHSGPRDHHKALTSLRLGVKPNLRLPKLATLKRNA